MFPNKILSFWASFPRLAKKHPGLVQSQMQETFIAKEEAGDLKKEEDVQLPETVMKRFTLLWFACYFENKLTKTKVVYTDLPKIISEMIGYFSTGTDRIDFRRAVPLMVGLNNLFTKRLNFLMRDSQSVLREMSDPVTVVKDEQEYNETKRSKQTQQQRTNTFKLNPQSFDWFLEGIDRQQLEALQTRLEQTVIRERHESSLDKIREENLVKVQEFSAS